MSFCVHITYASLFFRFQLSKVQGICPDMDHTAKHIYLTNNWAPAMGIMLGTRLGPGNSQSHKEKRITQL